MSSRIFTKLLLAFVVVIGALTLILDFSVRAAWEKSLRDEIERSLTEKTRQLANRIAAGGDLKQIVNEAATAADARVTVIQPDGKVLADSDANPDRMENHATRPEFIAALHGQVGSNTRRSHTLGIEFLYVAVPLPNGAARMAYPLDAIRRLNAQITRTLLISSSLAVLLALLISGVAAFLVSRRLQRIVDFAEKVAAGDLGARISEASFDEIGRVAVALDRTADHLEQAFAQLRESRENLETVLDSMQEPVIAFGADRRVHWTNKAMAAIFPEAKRSGGMLLESIRDPELLHAAESTLKDRIISQVRLANAVPGRVFEGTVAPSPGGAAVAVLHDITEIERTEKMRRDFIADVSHELRTPLTSIRGYTETLLDAKLDDSARQFLLTIQKNSERMSRLTEDLLTLASVESGEVQFHPVEVNAAALVREAVATFQSQASEKGLTLAASPNLSSGEVEADRDAIQRVFANLVENAIRYSAAPASITVGAREREHEVEFFVQDSGPGIASEHLPNLFKRFYRVDKARSRESGGTGLGLAIVKHIVRAHGGEVKVESRLNHGSTFSFTLPKAHAAERTSARV